MSVAAMAKTAKHKQKKKKGEDPSYASLTLSLSPYGVQLMQAN